MLIVDIRMLNSSNHELEAHKCVENQIYRLEIFWTSFTYFSKSMKISHMKLNALMFNKKDE